MSNGSPSSGPDRAGPQEHLAPAAKVSGQPGALDELRDRINVLVAVLEDDPRPVWELHEARWRSAELAEALAPFHPSARRVRSRWIRLAPLVRELRPDFSVTTIDSLINDAL